MSANASVFDGVISPLVWEDVSDRCRDAVGCNALYRVIAREDGTACLRFGAHDRAGVEYPSPAQAFEAAESLYRADMIARLNMPALVAAYFALEASTRYLDGTNPFHFSNGVRNTDQRDANRAALAGLKGDAK